MKRTALFTVTVAVVLGLFSSAPTTSAQERSVPSVRRLASGDVNGDGVRDISDTVFLLNWLFGGGPEPIKPDGDDPPAELLARIQVDAELTLASLPPEELIARMPRRISKGLLRARKLFAVAAVEAPTWGVAEFRQYGDSVQWVATLVPIAYANLCSLSPSCQAECLAKCGDDADVCMNQCPDATLDPMGYLECSVTCSTAAVRCAENCFQGWTFLNE